MDTSSTLHAVPDPVRRDVLAPASLYQRLGGSRGIAAIVDDIIALHMINPLIKTRFQAIEPARLPVVKKNLCDFFGAGTGGPETYGGKDLVSAHTGMNVNEQELVAAIDDVLVALDRNAVGPDEKNEVVAILYSLKDQVVRR